MAPGLNIQIKREASFTELAAEVKRVLQRMLNSEPIRDLQLELPPQNRNLSLRDAVLANGFPGAYVSLSDIRGSMVDILVFGSEARRLVGCSSVGRTAASDVLTAAVAIAAARTVKGTIRDDGHYWCDRDEYRADELMAALELPEEEPKQSVAAAIDLVSKKQFKPPSYGNG